MTDLANVAAAITAGYKKTQTDHGSTVSPRYSTTLTKPRVSGGGGIIDAFGESNADAATADTNCLAALNGQRRYTYGNGSSANKDAAGNQLVFDN